MDRPNWNNYFRTIAEVVAVRSTCLRRKVGCVFVRDNAILATGYNGAPKGVEHCETAGCVRDQLAVPSGERHELCRAVHAEQNAICQAARNGVSLKGSTVYVTVSPCIICAKMLINVGVRKIYYSGRYSDRKGLALLEESGIELEMI